MESSVFVEANFCLLIVMSVVLPPLMYLLQWKKFEASPFLVLAFGLVLTAISGLDVYLLQALATASRLTPSLVDNAIFDSKISLGLYVLPFLFGGIGINMTSNMLVGHLRNAGDRYTVQHATPSPSLRRKRCRTTGLPGIHVQAQKAVGARSSVILPFTGQEALRKKVGALLECLTTGARAPGIPLHELLSSGFMATHTHFGTIDDMFESSDFGTMSQGDCNNLSGDAWNAFVHSTTQFSDWENMLQSACCHWLAHKLYTDNDDRTRLRTPFISVRALTAILQPPAQQWHDWSEAVPHGPRGMTSRPATAAKISGVGHE
ncbi:MAG: hypothetical protein ACREPU_08170 [Rhodanobacteraceae bacterium]